MPSVHYSIEISKSHTLVLAVILLPGQVDNTTLTQLNCSNKLFVFHFLEIAVIIFFIVGLPDTNTALGGYSTCKQYFPIPLIRVLTRISKK